MSDDEVRYERFISDPEDLVVTRPQCVQCIHFHGNLMSPTCDAFSGYIPSQIWLGTFIHVDPFPGDHGKRFKRIEETPSE